MKIENRQQFLVGLTVAAVGLFVLVNFILTPLGGWWSTRQAQIKKLSEEVKEGRILVSRETSIRSRWQEMQKNSLPADPSVAEQQLFNAVDEWSKASGAEVASLMPQWKNDSTNYLTLNCRVETAGDMTELSRFLYDLEKGSMALRLDSIELGARDKEGTIMTLSTEINGLALLPKGTK